MRRPARSSKDDLALSADAQSRALGRANRTYGFVTSRSDLNGFWQITELDDVDRVPLDRLLASCLAFDGRKPADLVALEQSMQRRSREMRDGRLEGIKAIVERQQRMLAERNSESFLLGAEYR